MNGVLIGLIDRIRMLDNDLIRLRSKLNTVLTIRENQKKKNPKQYYYKYRHENTIKQNGVSSAFYTFPEYINTSIRTGF